MSSVADADGIAARSGLELANDNAAALWLGRAAAHGWQTASGPAWTAVRCEGPAEGAHRVLLTRAPADPGALTAELLELFRRWDTRALHLEDPYRVLDLSRHGCEAALPAAVMVRQAAGAGAESEPRTPVPTGEVQVHEAGAEPQLADVERVVVQGFPLPSRLPWRRGAQFPPEAMARCGPALRQWLALRHGTPAGACLSWDDGAAVGLYYVAVLPEHRGRGVGRTLVRAVLDAHPGRAAVLTATLLGEPLYRRLGFREVGTSVWWRFPGTPQALRS